MIDAIEIEKQVLVTFFYSRLSREYIASLQPNYFESWKHQEIFRELAEQYKETGEINNIDIAFALKDKIPLAYFIDELNIDKSGSIASIENAVNALKEMHLSRELQKHFNLSKKENGLDQLIYLKSEIEKLETEIKSGSVEQNRHEAFIEYINTESQLIKTHIPKLDKNNIAFERGELVIIAARPSVGKTAFACTLAHNLTKYGQHSIDCYSFEMVPNAFRRRIVANMASISIENIRARKLTDIEMRMCISASQEIEEQGLLKIYGATGMDIHDLVSQIKLSKSEICIIDYLQQIPARGISEETKIVATCARELAAVAKSKKIVCILLSQISREAQDRVPTLKDLRWSGDIEQAADVVIFLHPQGNDKSLDVEPIDVIVAKNRDGSTPRGSIVHDKRFSRFYEPEVYHQPQEF